MRYSATSPAERRQMLDALGLKDMDALFRTIPESDRHRGGLDIRGPLPEAELLEELERIKAEAPAPRVSLVGQGLYDHYIPASARSLFSRSEWVTSYTPYQAEISQGTLVMYYEFQTWVALLTGQQVANGGMYDGSTALAEAVLMARRVRRGASSRVWVSEGLLPSYRRVLETYARFAELELMTLPCDERTGRTKVELSAQDQKDALCIVVQSPNRHGIIEARDLCAPEAFLVSVCAEAQSLALLPPMPAAISVGDMQSLGIPMQLGGPTAGFFATSRDHIRQLPGRLVARTKDGHDREAFCITLATREQFIRREKATSNICTASGLMCLRSVLYMGLLGSAGMRKAAERSARITRWLVAELEKLQMPRVHTGPFFNEVVIDVSKHPELHDRLLEAGIVFGKKLDQDRVVLALTEKHSHSVFGLLEEIKSRV